MKGRVLFTIAVVLLLSVLLNTHPTQTQAFEPAEPTALLQWNQGQHLWSDPPPQEPRLRLELGERLIWSDRPVQIDVPDSGAPARNQFDLRIQYRLMDFAEWGKLEAYFGSAYLTHEDVPDRLDLAVALGHTFADTCRLEAGHLRGLNIGRPNHDRGSAQWWIGGSCKAYTNSKTLLDVYGRYYLSANVSPEITNRVGTDEPIRGEIGSRLFYNIGKHFFLVVAPYALLNDGFDRIGIYPAIRYNIGEAFKPLPAGAVVELGGNASTDYNKSADAIWLRITVPLQQ